MNHWEQMQQLRNCGAELAQNLQHPLSRSLTRVKGENKVKLCPNPIIRRVSQTEELVGENTSIRGQNKLYTVSGLTKKYARGYLEEQTVDFLIDDCILCELLELKDEGLTWTVTLVEKRGQQQFPVNNPYI